MPALVFAAFRGVLGEDGNEGDAKGCASNEIVQEVGECESGVICVGHGIGTDLMRDDPFAYESQDAAEQNASHNDGRGGHDATIYARLTHRIMVEVLRKIA